MAMRLKYDTATGFYHKATDSKFVLVYTGYTNRNHTTVIYPHINGNRRSIRLVVNADQLVTALTDPFQVGQQLEEMELTLPDLTNQQLRLAKLVRK
jgi:hypothetical protein